jgi:uncharacterized membrane protein
LIGLTVGAKRICRNINPPAAIGTLGVLMIVLHNGLDAIQVGDFGAWGWVWKILHEREDSTLKPLESISIMLNFPLIPWVGVMAAGFGLGPLLLVEQRSRRRMLLLLGVALTVAFFALRWYDHYGDSKHWSPQNPDEVGSEWPILAFINCENVPPSLLYLLMTLGPVFLVWGGLDRKPAVPGTPRLGELFTGPLQWFGRVPLFFYLGQWLMLHLLALGLALLEGRPTEWLFSPLDQATQPLRFRHWNHNSDIGWQGALLAAVMTVLILYPVCVWYAGVKRRHPGSWLRFV